MIADFRLPISDWAKRCLPRLACVFTGHPCKPTGRHGILLREWHCQRCGGLYVSHSDYGNALVNADASSDIIFRDCMDAIADDFADAADNRQSAIANRQSSGGSLRS